MPQTSPEMQMMARVVMDVNVIVDWPRADSFTSKQLIAVRKPSIAKQQTGRHVEMSPVLCDTFYTTSQFNLI